MKSLLFVCLVLVAVVAAKAGREPLSGSYRQCSRTLCAELRACSGGGETVKSKSPETQKKQSSKTAEASQGKEVGSECYQNAVNNYYNCLFGEVGVVGVDSSAIKTKKQTTGATTGNTAK